MNKIISFSLWGNLPRYSHGAIRNCEIAREYYTDWLIYIYYNDIESWCLDQLSEFNNTKLINCENKQFISPYFWRFFAFFDDDENIVLSRDCDSRLSLREKTYTDLWLQSDKKIFNIKDHIRHYDFPMLAGMFGIKYGLPSKYYDLMLEYGKQHYYTVDQHYLRYVWNDYKDDILEVGIQNNVDFYNSRQENLPHFIGQSYDENEHPIYAGE
jgi:hypothetical protein